MNNQDITNPLALANQEAEMAVIGSILLDANKIGAVKNIPLLPSDFFMPNYRNAYRIILERWDLGMPTDKILTVNNAPENWVDLVTECMESVPGSERAVYYGRLVKELSLRRKLYTETENLAKDCLSDLPMEDLLSYTNKFDELKKLKDTVFDLDELSDQAFEWIKQNKIDSEMKTGLAELDDQIGGLRRQNLIVIGGWSSHCKSALMQNLVLTNLKLGKIVYYYSYELSAKIVYTRMAGIEAGLPIYKIMSPRNLSVEEEERLASAKVSLLQYKKNLIVRDYFPYHLMMNEIWKADLVIIDYLQPLVEMTVPENKYESKYDQHKNTMLSLRKSETKNNNCIIIGSQLTYPDSSTTRIVPLISDTRDCKDIGNYADIVLLNNWPKKHIVRNEKAVKRLLHKRDEDIVSEKEFHIYIGKNNNGQSDTRIDVSINPETLKFTNKYSV